MSDDMTGTCRVVVERLVETGARPLDAAAEAHVRSCISCFRAMADLRDLPRVADALRAAAPPVPVDDRFWEALAARTAEAAAATLAVAPAVPATLKRRVSRTGGRWRSRLVSFGALAVAAAAAWTVMLRNPVVPQQSEAPAGTMGARLSREESSSEALNDVAELDAAGLRRLLDRLGAHTPAALARGVADGIDAADVPPDDEARVSDEVAQLDGDGLRRVARSLEQAAL